MMPDLTSFTFDFGDGNGPLTFYARRTSLGEQKQIEAVKKSHWEMIDGQKELVIDNATESIVTAFLIRARDGLGARMFMQPADAKRVWDEFDPRMVMEAVAAMNALDLAGKP